MTLEEKIKQVKKYGLTKGIDLNPEEEILLLRAHIEYLEERNHMLYTSMEEIASGYAEKEQVRSFAEYILNLYNLRSWKNTDL